MNYSIMHQELQDCSNRKESRWFISHLKLVENSSQNRKRNSELRARKVPYEVQSMNRNKCCFDQTGEKSFYWNT